MIRSIGSRLKDTTTIERQQTLAHRADQQLWFRCTGQYADCEGDDAAGRQLETCSKTPDKRAVRVVFDETLRAGDEQMVVEQGCIAKDRLGAERLEVGRQRTV